MSDATLPVEVPAPALAPVAAVWFDGPEEASVATDDGRRYWLVGVGGRVPLVALATPAARPRAVAEALAEGLAGCDLPPRGGGVDTATSAAVLRAGRLRDEPVPWPDDA